LTSIKDVAALAGVGVGTVSRVLNDHGSVSPATKARVEDAITRLGYRPNRAARALSHGRFGVVAVLVPYLTHPSAVVRLSGVMSVMDAAGYDLIVCNVDRPRARASHLNRLTRGDLADGLLIMTLRPSADEVRCLAEAGMPTVVIDAESPSLPSVSSDDVTGGRLAGAHLLQLGHRRIAYLADAVDPRFGFTSSPRRREGLEDALTAAGSPLDPRRVGAGIHDRDVARNVARALLEQPDRPTAVFAHSDLQALGVLDVAAELGLRVPEDLSVVGFDDIDLAANAGLTTIRQPLFDTGRLGAARLLEVLASGSCSGPEHLELPLELVVRHTTGPVPDTVSKAVRRKVPRVAVAR